MKLNDMLNDSQLSELQDTSPDQKYGGEIDINLPQVPINVLTNVMPEETDVPLIRQALRQINLERGINKRMMPALKAFLKPYTDILSSGFTGFNQLSALRKALATTDPTNPDAQQAMDTAVSSASDYEPSEDEVLAYAVKHNIQAVTDEQKAYIKSLMKGDKDVAQTDPSTQEKEPQMASKQYDNKPLDELKKLAGLLEEESMPSKSQVMKMCKDGKSKKEICDMYPNCDKEKLKSMIDDCKKELKEGLGYAQPGEDSERVTYSKTKKMGDASITINANAESMKELHDVLRLAGVDFEDDGKHDDTPDHKDHDDHEDHEDHEDHDSEEPTDKKPLMVIKPQDANYSTDKEVLVNYLKDKLKKSIS